MTRHPAFWRTAVLVLLAGAILLFAVARADGATVVKEPPCRNLSISGPVSERGWISYTAGAYCPQASYVRWTLTIRRAGVLWASRSDFISQTPSVRKRCVRGGPGVPIWAELRVDSWYGAGTKHTRKLRGPPFIVRCLP